MCGFLIGAILLIPDKQEDWALLKNIEA